MRRAEAGTTVARRLVEVRQAELAAASAALDRANDDLSRTRISAPVAGRLAPFETRAGDSGIVGQPLLALIRDSDWRLVANIAERHLARLRPDQVAGVVLGSDPWRDHAGHGARPRCRHAPAPCTTANSGLCTWRRLRAGRHGPIARRPAGLRENGLASGVPADALSATQMATRRR